MRRTLVVILLVAALLMVQVHAREDDDNEHEQKHEHDDDIDHHSRHKHQDNEHSDEKEPEETETERPPEPRANAVLQNSQPSSSSSTKEPAHSTHHHHHHHHHNATTEADTRQRAVTCIPRSIVGRIRDLLVDELTVVVLYQFEKNATIPNGITFENYLVECLKHVKMEIKINNYPYKNVTIVPGATLTPNQVASIDDLPFLSTFDLKLKIAQKSPSEEEYSTDDRQTKTCYSAPSPVVNLRRSTLANGSLYLEWEAPAQTNAPSICYYQIVVKDLNNNTERTHNQQERTFTIAKEELKSQYRITVYAINSQSCYISMYPFVEDCRKKDLGSVAQFIDYRPHSMTTTKKPNGADQLKLSSILLMVPLVASIFAKY